MRLLWYKDFGVNNFDHLWNLKGALWMLHRADIGLRWILFNKTIKNKINQKFI